MHHADKVAMHVHALNVLMHENIVALLTQDEYGTLQIVCPTIYSEEVLDMLSRVDWGHGDSFRLFAY